MIYTLFIFNVMIILHLLVRMMVNFLDNKPILEGTEVDKDTAIHFKKENGQWTKIPNKTQL